MVENDTFAEDTNPLLNIDSNVRGDIHMEIENSPGLSSRYLKLSAVDIFLDKFEGTGDKFDRSFKISDNLHGVSVELMKEIATFAKGNSDFNKPMMLFGLRF